MPSSHQCPLYLSIHSNQRKKPLVMIHKNAKSGPWVHVQRYTDLGANLCNCEGNHILAWIWKYAANGQTLRYYVKCLHGSLHVPFQHFPTIPNILPIPTILSNLVKVSPKSPKFRKEGIGKSNKMLLN